MHLRCCKQCIPVSPPLTLFPVSLSAWGVEEEKEDGEEEEERLGVTTPFLHRTGEKMKQKRAKTSVAISLRLVRKHFLCYNLRTGFNYRKITRYLNNKKKNI